MTIKSTFLLSLYLSAGPALAGIAQRAPAPATEPLSNPFARKLTGDWGGFRSKLADLVILDKNPLKIEPMALKDLKVLETIKEGKTVYTFEK